MPPSTAYIFPGQGAQYVGMGKDLYERSVAARAIFNAADKALGVSLTTCMFEGPAEELERTPNCQPAILTMSIAALAAREGSCIQWRNDHPPRFVAGLSLGEYTALVVAGALSFEDAVVLVRKRGEIMQRGAVDAPGKMASLIGLERDAVASLCKATALEIANINCPGQIVVSGAAAAIERLETEAQAFGAKKVVVLDVSGAFHSSFMKGAAQVFEGVLAKTPMADTRIPVVSNVDARPHTAAGDLRQLLVKQLYSPVLWQESVEYMIRQGVDSFIEVGPGKVLKGLLKRIDPTRTVVTIGTMEDCNAT
jgi:[acyl-carrier-protein] S-malonyltransferase